MKTISSSCRAMLAFIVLLLPATQAQFVSSLPQCVQDCIDSSQDDNCSAMNVGCLCRASAGNFLPDLITCMHANCDEELDNNLLLTPLQFACDLAGSPIPASALRNAENLQSSLEAQSTMIMTVTADGSSATSGAEATTTVEESSSSTSTVTSTTTDKGGNTVFIVYPITIGSTTTVSGSRFTVTTTAGSSGFTGVIPVIITSTDNSGSTWTTTTTQPGAISTFTTTNSRGSTVTRKSTYTETTTAKSSSSSDSVTRTTTSTTLETSSHSSSSKTTTSINPDETDSAPFKQQSLATRKKALGSCWMGLGVFIALGCVWF